MIIFLYIALFFVGTNASIDNGSDEKQMAAFVAVQNQRICVGRNGNKPTQKLVLTEGKPIESQRWCSLECKKNYFNCFAVEFQRGSSCTIVMEEAFVSNERVKNSSCIIRRPVPRGPGDDLRPCDDTKGCKSTTLSGRTCQRWNTQTPHIHGYGLSMLPKNYCRNPDGTASAMWCYTKQEGTRWEFCEHPPIKAAEGVKNIPAYVPPLKECLIKNGDDGSKNSPCCKAHSICSETPPKFCTDVHEYDKLNVTAAKEKQAYCCQRHRLQCRVGEAKLLLKGSDGNGSKVYERTLEGVTSRHSCQQICLIYNGSSSPMPCDKVDFDIERNGNRCTFITSPLHIPIPSGTLTYNLARGLINASYEEAISQNYVRIKYRNRNDLLGMIEVISEGDGGCQAKHQHDGRPGEARRKKEIHIQTQALRQTTHVLAKNAVQDELYPKCFQACSENNACHAYEINDASEFIAGDDASDNTDGTEDMEPNCILYLDPVYESAPHENHSTRPVHAHHHNSSFPSHFHSSCTKVFHSCMLLAWSTCTQEDESGRRHDPPPKVIPFVEEEKIDYVIRKFAAGDNSQAPVQLGVKGPPWCTLKIMVPDFDPKSKKKIGEKEELLKPSDGVQCFNAGIVSVEPVDRPGGRYWYETPEFILCLVTFILALIIGVQLAYLESSRRQMRRFKLKNKLDIYKVGVPTLQEPMRHAPHVLL